ncbi:cysteine desulfurase family protein [Actinotalea sp. Marseille-Q4924]|uniref:cysteine desulfurase family protein n=1 Tax=Actinotalea sp. Marseille-Q4924 TaxID=2866571 RepID=UPI001CE43F93|nr:aminotransferase class V-fold PLP-dependent enzyme [Actinotalea sp. Marseille-Q4924]
MEHARVYLDAAGRAPLHAAAVEAWRAAEAEGWADPRGLHAEGRRARLLLEGARESLAASLGCRTEEVHLLASHTAALHGGVLSVTRARRRTGTRVVASAVERAAVHAAARFLDADGPAAVPVDATGRVDLDAWRDAVSAPGVALAALQHANGEVGTVQPLTEALAATRQHGVPLLVDAGASVGHLPVPPEWDVITADPAAWGGPAGVGVLAVRSRTRTVPAWPEDEDTWSPGGVSVPAAFAAAVSLAAVLRDREEEERRRRALVDRLRGRVSREVPDVEVVGDPAERLPHVVTFSCLYVDGEALLGELDRHGFAVGSGSACTSSAQEPSHVLAAMGALTHGNVRIGLHRTTTAEDVDRFCDVLPGAVAHVRGLTGATGL